MTQLGLPAAAPAAGSADGPAPASSRWWLFYAVGIAVALPFYMLFATERFTPLARFLAWLGLAAAALPGVVFLTRRGAHRNSLVATAMNIVLFYQLSVFHERFLTLRWGHARITDASVERALLLAALAVPALWAGWAASGTLALARVVPHLRLDVPLPFLRRVGIIAVLVSLLANLGWVYGLLPNSGVALSVLAVLTPTELGMAMLLMPTLLGQPGRHDKRIFFALLALHGALALGVGQLIVVIRPLLVYLLGWLLVGRRLLLRPVLIGAAVVLIMQPVKAEFRSRVWDRPTELTLGERAQLYVELIGEHWLGETNPVDTGQSLETAAARTAAALALANYVELTPSAVPFQEGATYRYFRYALIPRIVYPDKPSAQYADVWAAVVYGYTSYAGTAHVMVGLSQIGESYINFGFFGGLLALAVLGMFYRVLDELLGHPRAGSGALALHLYFTLSVMVASEGSTAQCWGGMPQLLLFYCVLLYVLGRYAASRRSA